VPVSVLRSWGQQRVLVWKIPNEFVLRLPAHIIDVNTGDAL